MSDMRETGLITSPPHLRLSQLIEASLYDKRRELGVKDGLKEIYGVTTLMLVTFGEHRINSIEDLAGCATDDLHGWRELRRGRVLKHAGILSTFGVSRKDCETIIINARVAAGWIEESTSALALTSDLTAQ
jgi:transcription termination/antitermination protein NusA